VKIISPPHLAEDPRADIDDERVLVHEQGKQAAREDHEGDAQPETEEKQEEIAFRCPCHGKHVVHGHGEVGDDDHPERLQDRRGVLPDFLVRGTVDEQLHGDPEDEEAPDQFDVRHLQQLGRKVGENNPQHDSRARTQQDSLLSLLPRQRADRRGDHHGVVSGENQIDQDNAHEGGKEFPAERYLP